jgi:CelD/BcsL family acetyltransferase involved in cellulose biosynthesis
VFLTSRWIRAVARGYRCRIACARVGEATPVAMAPGIILGYPLLRVWYSMLPYGGVIGPGASDPTVWEQLLRDLLRAGCVQAQWVPEEPADPAVPARAVRSVSHRRSLPADAESLWADLDRHRRSDVRRAGRDGVEVAIREDRAAPHALARLYRGAMREHRARQRYGPALLEAIAEGLGAEDRGFVLATRSGRPVAGALVLYSARTAHLLVAATSPAGRACGAGDVVLAQALRTAVARGMTRFDFMGTPPGDETVARWKEKWGGEPREVVRYVARLSGVRGALVDWALALTAGRPRGRGGRRPPAR